MYFLIIMLFFITNVLFIYLLQLVVFKKKILITSRLSQISILQGEKNSLDDRERLPFRTRVVIPIIIRIKKIIHKVTPLGIQKEMMVKLQAANFPYGLNVTGWIIFNIFCSLVAPICFIFMLYKNNMNQTSKIILFIVIGFICILFPRVVLNERIKIRKRKLQNQLPDIIDMLTVSVEAGLSFEGALTRVVKTNNSELSGEFARTLKEMQLGKTRKQSMMDMANRCDVSELKIFISTLIQAELLGMSIANVLRAQSTQMRILRRQRAQETALKAPVKILIPLILFIFPSIFIVTLGPAIIQIINFFGNQM